MTKTQYRAALKSLGLTIVGAAKVLGVSPRQAQRYAQDDDIAIPGPVARLLRAMIKHKIDPAEVAKLD